MHSSASWIVIAEVYTFKTKQIVCFTKFLTFFSAKAKLLARFSFSLILKVYDGRQTHNLLAVSETKWPSMWKLCVGWNKDKSNECFCLLYTYCSHVEVGGVVTLNRWQKNRKVFLYSHNNRVWNISGTNVAILIFL